MIDREQIYLWWQLFQNSGNDLCEIRCLGPNNKTYSGYYRNIEKLIADIEPISNRDNFQIYFCMNHIDENCYDREQHERLVEKPKNTTNDNDIDGRKFILIDLDPKRSAGIGSTNEQLELAHKMAVKVFNFLTDQGFYEPIVAQSGNGYHLLIPIRLSNAEDKRVENTKLIERFLKAISMMFATDKVDVDLKVFNASRICKLYGTYAKKGTNTEEHPWRLSRIIRYPETIENNSKEYVEKVANMYPEEKPAPTRENNFGQEKFDIIDFFSRHGIEYRAVNIAGGTRYILKECPFDSNHKDPDSMVFQHDNGALSFMCYHNSCSQYTWKDFRLHFEPDAYDKKDYREYQAKRKYYERYTQPEPLKEENPTDGKKWLSLDDIQTVRDEDLVAIPTGVRMLDRAMKGLILGEMTVISGINGSGKSVFLNTLALNACERNYPTAIFSGELQNFRLKGWLMQTAAGKGNVIKDPSVDFAYETDPNVIPKIEGWLKDKLFIYNNNYGSKYGQLLADIKECIKNHNTKLIIIDNLMAVDLSEVDGDKNEKQKQLLLALSQLAKEKGIHIVLVAHPRKEQGNAFLRKEGVSGSADIINLTDNLFLIHRVGDDFAKRATEFWGQERVNRILMEDYGTVIEIAKNRSYGVVDYVVGLFYEIETRRFKNSVAEQIHYSWEEPAHEEYSIPEGHGWSCGGMTPNTSFDDGANIQPMPEPEPTPTLVERKEPELDCYGYSWKDEEEPPF